MLLFYFVALLRLRNTTGPPWPRRLFAVGCVQEGRRPVIILMPAAIAFEEKVGLDFNRQFIGIGME